MLTQNGVHLDPHDGLPQEALLQAEVHLQVRIRGPASSSLFKIHLIITSWLKGYSPASEANPHFTS